MLILILLSSVRYLGVDFGVRKIGLAIGDGETGLAFPLGVIPGGEDAPERIVEIARKEGAGELVAGIPIPAAHHTDDQLKLTLKFVSALADASTMSVHMVDEQFSSAEARRVQKEYGAQAEEDALAAMLILQAYLDEQRRVK